MRDLFWKFVVERERIRSVKGTEPPYTDDPRLRDYWFPNIRRTDDPTTIAWLDLFALHITDPRDRLVANIAYRLFSKTSSALAIRHILLEHGWNTGMVLEEFKGANELLNGRLLGVLPGNLPKLCEVMDRVVAATNLPFMVGDSIESNVWALTTVKGIGPVIAYEIALDLHHELRCCDGISWAAQTPGAVRGASLVLDEELNPDGAMGQAKTFFLMKDLYAEAGHAWGWELSEMQRALCLYYAYARHDPTDWRYRWK